MFSDEIYSDSIEEEEIGRFVSLLRFKEVWPWLVYANSFTKAYNCSGNGSAYTIVFNKELNNKLSEQQFHNFYYPTVFSTALMKACYGYGAVWLKGVNKVVRDNYNIVKDYFGNKMSTILVYDLDCSYLMLLDFKNVEQDGKRLENRLKVEQIYPTYLTNFFAE